LNAVSFDPHNLTSSRGISCGHDHLDRLCSGKPARTGREKVFNTIVFCRHVVAEHASAIQVQISSAVPGHEPKIP
jgi:hypothetical protein